MFHSNYFLRKEKKGVSKELQRRECLYNKEVVVLKVLNGASVRNYNAVNAYNMKSFTLIFMQSILKNEASVKNYNAVNAYNMKSFTLIFSAKHFKNGASVKNYNAVNAYNMKPFNYFFLLSVLKKRRS